MKENPHLKNMCNLMNIDFGDSGEVANVSADEDYLFDLFNDQKTLKTRSVTTPPDSVTVKIGEKILKNSR